MATEQELRAALLKANAAGDTASAQVFANKIKAMNPAASATPAPKERGEIGQSWDRLKGDVKTYASGITSGALWDPKQNNTPQSQAVVKAADSIGQDAMDLPVSVVRAGLRKVGMSEKGAADLTGAAMILSPYGGPLLRDVGMAGAAGKASVMRTAGKAGELMGAKKRGAELSSTMGGQSQVIFKGNRLTGEEDATQAAMAADRVRTVAERARTLSQTNASRQIDTRAQAVTPKPEIAPVRGASELGELVRKPALENEAATADGMRERDTQFRAAMEEVANAHAETGKGVSDTEAGKSLIEASRKIANPDPVTGPTVTDWTPDRAKLHKEILSVLEPKRTRLDPDQVAAAVARGDRLEVHGGDTFKVQVPSLEAADNLARKLGKIGSGEIKEHEAIGKLEAGDLRRKVIAAMDEYADGTPKAVRDNWRLGKEAQQKFEKARIGKKIVGVENGTRNTAVSSSKIPDAIINGGRDAVEQAKLAAGEGPVRDMLHGYVQNEFGGATTAKQLESMVAPGSTLHDVVSGDSELMAAVKAHIDNVHAAEGAGVKAEELGRRASNNSSRADRLNKIADELSGKATASVERARKIRQEMTLLRVSAPHEVGPKYIKLLQEEHTAGRINDEQFNRGVVLASAAKKAFKSQAEMDKWIGEAGWLAGGGTIGGMIGGPHGLVIGSTLGAGARAARRKMGNMGR